MGLHGSLIKWARNCDYSWACHGFVFFWGVNVTKHRGFNVFYIMEFHGRAHSWRRVAIKVFRREEDSSTS